MKRIVTIALMIGAITLVEARSKYTKDSCGYRLISQDDYKRGQGMVLTKSGNYKLCSSIRFAPTSRGNDALVIDGDNIHLDLAGFEISQTNDTKRTVGIRVTAGHKNVSIKHGLIKDFTEFGIIVEGNNKDICLGEETSLLTVTGCGFGAPKAFVDEDGEPLLQGGIRLGESRVLEGLGYYTCNGPLKSVTCTKVVTLANSPLGMILGVGSAMSFNKCSFSGNINARLDGRDRPLGTSFSDFDFEASVYGAFVSANAQEGDVPSRAISFTSCFFNENEVQAGVGQRGAGFVASGRWEGLALSKCTASSNRAPADSGMVHGYVAEGGTGTRYHECSVTQNVGGFQCVGLGHFGIPGIQGEEGIVAKDLQIEECALQNNVAGTAAAIAARSSAILARKTQGVCIDTTNIAGNTAILAPTTAQVGIDLEDVGHVFIRNSNIDVSDSQVTFAIGVTWEPIGDEKGFILQNCVITGSQEAQSSRGVSLADRRPVPDNVPQFRIEGCLISEFVQGIQLFRCSGSLVQHNRLVNISSEGCRLIGCDCVSVRGNYFANVGSGVQDSSVQSTNLIAQNKVFNATTNAYEVTYGFAPFPSKDGDLVTGFPNQPLGACDNASVAKEPVVQAQKEPSFVERLLQYFWNTHN